MIGEIEITNGGTEESELNAIDRFQDRIAQRWDIWDRTPSRSLRGNGPEARPTKPGTHEMAKPRRKPRKTLKQVNAERGMSRAEFHLRLRRNTINLTGRESL